MGPGRQRPPTWMDAWAGGGSGLRRRAIARLFCVSCHTSLPYALARPALRTALAERGPSANESKFLDNISRRVSLWAEVQPFYSDAKNGAPKSAESRGTEAVLNALILSRYRAPAAQDALRNMWELQLKTGEQRGSWTWLNFHNEPWEADDSPYWAAALAGLAVALGPRNTGTAPRFGTNLRLLGEYLQRELQSQSTLNRAVAFGRRARRRGLLDPRQRAAICRGDPRQAARRRWLERVFAGDEGVEAQGRHADGRGQRTVTAPG